MRPVYAEINLSALRRNISTIRNYVTPAKILVMLKANAYGHGVDGVAPFIEPHTDYIGVAIVEEGIHLRKLGIKKPILVVGGTLPEQLPLFIEHDLILTISSLDLLNQAESAAQVFGKRITAHLKIDTGMERVGVHEYEAEQFLIQSLALKHIHIEGIYTHFANADSNDLTHARLQLERFQDVLRFYEKRSLPYPIRHTANSSALMQLPESHLDMVRPGIVFYGIHPEDAVQKTFEVEPALTWKAQIAFSKITPPNRPVGYGSSWQSDHPVRIATIPCGYADGYFRRMSNKPQVMIRGKKYQQVGRICMDQFMVNLENDSAEVGDEVILLGGEIRAEDLAEWAGTNPYEVCTNISARVPRVFVQD